MSGLAECIAPYPPENEEAEHAMVGNPALPVAGVSASTLGKKIMNETPSASIPVDRLVEIQNASGDTLSVTPRGKQGWHAQVVRGGQRHRKGSMQILNQELPELKSLKTAVDAFLVGDYRDFQELEANAQGRWRACLGILVTVILSAAALTFLALMISIFLRIR